MKLDLSKYAQNENGHWVVPTREGGLAIIFTDKSPESYPLAGYYEGGVRQWCHNGFYYGDFRHSDYDLLPPEPKTKEVTVWAHWIDAPPELYGDKDVFFEKDNLSKSTSYRSTKLLAVKPITFTITEGEGL